MHTIAQNKKRLYSLSILRALSAICVVLYHYTYQYSKLYVDLDWSFKLPYGYIAVNVFFLLSGFLMMYHLKQQSFKEKLMTRAIRLYPTYWVCLLITTICMAVLMPSALIGPKDWLMNLSMIQTTLGIPSIDGAYWSMSYEILCYIGFALLTCRKYTDRSITIALGSWLMLAYTASLLTLTGDEHIAFFIKIMTKLCILDRAYAFIIGCILARIILKKCSKLDFLSLFLALCYPGSKIGMILAIVSILLLLLVKTELRYPARFGSHKLIKTADFFAKISFPLYLLHQNIGYAIINLFVERSLTHEIILLVPILLLISLAYLVHRFIEVRLSYWLESHIHRYRETRKITSV